MIDFTEFVKNDPRNSRDHHTVTEESLTKRCAAMLPPELLSGKSVLDIGCAVGAMGHWVLSHGAKHYTGIEIQPEYAATATDLLAAYHSNWYITNSLNNAYGNYDLVIASGVIHGVFDPYGFIREICKRANGYIVVESLYNHDEEPYPYPLIKMRPLQMIKHSSPNDPYDGIASYPNKKAHDLLFAVNGFEVDIDRIYPERILNSHDPYNGITGKDRFITRYKIGKKMATLEDEINVGIQQRSS